MIPTRLWEHRTAQNPKCFTARYNLFKLIYYEGFETIREAVERERYLKGKKRDWKENLIRIKNPKWNDLTDELKVQIQEGGTDYSARNQ